MELGKKQILVMVKKVEFGIYLAKSVTNQTERVLLPKKQVPEDMEIGDPIEVFIYKDSQDRIVATTNEPLLMMGQIAKLKVLEVGQIGAFLDWGLEKDLFLPFRQQTTKVSKNDEVLVSLYVDKSDRLCATMKIYPSLSKESPYKAGDEVSGTIYEISPNFGAFVAVDDKYSGLIPKKELFENKKVLEKVTARVTAVKEDGKLDLSIRRKSHEMMNEDGEKILALLKENKGFLPIGDKSSPEEIREKVQMSKNEFKRAIGRLYKGRLITIEEHGIRLAK